MYYCCLDANTVGNFTARQLPCAKCKSIDWKYVLLRKSIKTICQYMPTCPDRGQNAFMTMRKIFAKCFPRQLNLPKTCNRAIMVLLQFVCLHGRSDERGTKVRESERADINPFCTVYPRVRAIRHSNGRWRVSPQMVRYNLTGHTSANAHIVHQ